jgi:hypothetical protein
LSLTEWLFRSVTNSGETTLAALIVLGPYGSLNLLAKDFREDHQMPLPGGAQIGRENIAAENGSTDGSLQMAKRGVRLAPVTAEGRQSMPGVFGRHPVPEREGNDHGGGWRGENGFEFGS